MSERKPYLSTLIAFLIALNVLSPLSMRGDIDASFFFPAIECQSNILFYTSFSVIPLSIVNRLFAETAAPHAKSIPHKKDQRKSGNPFEFSPASCIQRISIDRMPTGTTAGSPPGHVPGAPADRSAPESGERSPGATPLIALALLLCAAILARSDPDGYLKTSAQILHPIRESLDRVFFLPLLPLSLYPDPYRRNV